MKSRKKTVLNAKTEVIGMVDRQVAFSLSKLDADELDIVNIINGKKANPKNSNLDVSELIVRRNNARAGCSLYDYVHLEKLCDIIEKLTT